MWPHVRAALVLVVGAVILILGTPGLDAMQHSELGDEDERQELREQIGPFWAGIGIGIADFNREHRLPLHRALHTLEIPIRGAQNWALYRDGPNRVRRLEIWVDDELKHRSADPEHDWLAPQLRMRRVRPMVETTTMQTMAQNWEGLSRFIVRRAVAEWPEAERVELRAIWTPFPGDGETTVHHRIVAVAPEWQVVHL